MRRWRNHISDCGYCGSRQQEEPRESMTDADGFMNIPDGIDEELPFA